MSLQDHGRRLVANLDAETELARLHHPPIRLGQPGILARRRLTATATLLRALAKDGDRLYLPTAPAEGFDPGRLPHHPGLPSVRLEWGPARSLPAVPKSLAWAQTSCAETFCSKNSRAEDSDPREIDRPPLDTQSEGEDLASTLWEAPKSLPTVTARVHGRDFLHHLQRRLGLALPGSRLLDGAAGLIQGVQAFEDRFPAQPWVLKPFYSAAGRGLTFGGGPAGSAFRQRLDPSRAARLQRRHGPLLLEPWVDRLEDFGCLALPERSGPRLLGFHRLRVDPKGRFLGIDLLAGQPDLTTFPLPPADRELLQRTLAEVSAALWEEGYRGPFGIDLFRYSELSGTPRLHPLGEINARMSVGLLARALAERLAKPMGWRNNARLGLRFGPALPTGLAEAIQCIPLLLPASEDPSACWLEVDTRRHR